MSQLREYVVSLHRFEDLDDFYEDMETPGGNLYIPNRAVDCSVRRPTSRNTHYYLTAAEAEQIKADPRVLDVELTPKDLGIVPELLSWPKTADYSYLTETSNRTWGLLRTAYRNNVSSLMDVSPNKIQRASINTGLGPNGNGKGKNVDIVLIDSHIDHHHPELQGRVIDYNWYLHAEAAGDLTRPSRYNYNKVDMFHGTHVAGTVAGLTQGWAPLANIYNIELSALGTDFSNENAMAWYMVFDYIRAWHSAKPINPETGKKNPTIVNNSWGFFKTVDTGIDWNTTLTDDILVQPNAAIGYIYYRGQQIALPQTVGNLRNLYGCKFWPSYVNGRYQIKYGFTVPHINVDIDDLCLLDGVAVVAAAGNDCNWIANPGTPDYDNAITVTVNQQNEPGISFFGRTLQQFYYMRGPSPASANSAICAGGIDPTDFVGDFTFWQPLIDVYTRDQGTSRGPGVDIYAPSIRVQSACAQNSARTYSSTFKVVPDPTDSGHFQVALEGTSMACPMVAGVLALYAEDRYMKNLPFNSTVARAALTINGDLFVSGQMFSSGSGYGNNRFIGNSNNRILALKNATVQLLSVGQTFNITADKTQVTEGGFVKFTIISTNVTDNTIVYWRVTNLTGTDLSPVSGSVPIIQNSCTITINILADNLTEAGAETFTLQVFNNAEYTGTALAVSGTITILDTSLTVEPTPSSLPFRAIDAVPTSNMNFDVATASRQLWIRPLTASIVSVNFRGNNSQSLASYLATNRELQVNLMVRNSAGKAFGVLSISIDGVLIKAEQDSGWSNSSVTGRLIDYQITFWKTGSTISARWSRSVYADDPTILKRPPLPPFFYIYPSVMTLGESQTMMVNLITENLPDNFPLSYDIVGTISANDISPGVLNGTVKVVNNRAQISIRAVLDSTADDNDYFDLRIKYFDEIAASTRYGIPAKFSKSGVESPGFGWIRIRDRNATYTVSRSVPSAQEGVGQITFTVTCTNVPPGARIPYTLSGTNITRNDFEGLPALTGFVTMDTSNGRSNVNEIGGWRLHPGRQIGNDFSSVWIRGNDVLCSDEPYWNPNSPKGSALQRLISQYKAAGFTASFVFNPFCLTHSFVNGKVIETPAITAAALVDEIKSSGAQFICIDPYLFPPTADVSRLGGQVFWTSAFLVQFTKNVIDVAKQLNLPMKVVLQGFANEGLSISEVYAHNAALLELTGINEFIVFGKEDAPEFQDDPKTVAIPFDFPVQVSGSLTLVPRFDGINESIETVTFTVTGPAVTAEGTLLPLSTQPKISATIINSSVLP